MWILTTTTPIENESKITCTFWLNLNFVFFNLSAGSDPIYDMKFRKRSEIEQCTRLSFVVRRRRLPWQCEPLFNVLEIHDYTCPFYFWPNLAVLLSKSVVNLFYLLSLYGYDGVYTARLLFTWKLKHSGSQ